MLTKNQRLIYALAGLKTIIGDYEFETKVKDNETGEVDIVDCYKEIETLIVEFINPQPYKFEELKKGMWIWDDKREFEDFRFIKIEKILSEFDCEHLYHDKNKKVFFDNIVCHAREFEENRFYPVTKALEYQIKEDENEEFRKIL